MLVVTISLIWFGVYYIRNVFSVIFFDEKECSAIIEGSREKVGIEHP